jgi:hypothetical protein
MKPSNRYFPLVAIIGLFFCVQTVVAQENISWLSNYTSDITVGSNTCNYSFKTLDNNPCKISIEEKKTDKKGASSTMMYQFYLSDVNTSAMNFKTSGSVAVVKLAIKQSQKFIRVYKDGVLSGYDSEASITMSEIDKARSFIDAMKSNVENCKSSERKWTSRSEALQWMAQNIGKSESSGTTYNQVFKPGEKSYLVSLGSESTDPKGVKQNQLYDFNLNDINAAKINMVVSGKTFKIELPVRENNYYIRLSKGADEISYVKEIEIFSDDLEQARNILNGMVYLVNETPAPERKKWDSYTAALGFVKENVKEVKSGTSTIGQSFSFEVSPSGSIQLATLKKDSKGVAVQNNKTIYLSDLQPSVTIEASSKSLTLNLITKDKVKYIKESNESGTLAYSGAVEIFETDLDKAREMVRALEFAIEKSEKGVLEFGSVDKAINWIKTNVGEIKVDAEKIDQSINVVASEENKIELKTVTTDAKGVSVTETFDIYSEDLKNENCKIKISGKKLAVVVSTGKTKYIKCFKDNALQNYSSDTEVFFDDVQKAKNFIAAINLLREKSQVTDRSFKDKALALAYIKENCKKLEVAGETFDQKMEERDGDPCKGKFTRIETNSKGASVENISEFTFSDLDPTNSTVTVSSKNLKVSLVTKNKEKLIKPYKNGEAGNFVNTTEIDVDNILVAKKLLGAFSSLVGFCK